MKTALNKTNLTKQVLLVLFFVSCSEAVFSQTLTQGLGKSLETSFLFDAQQTKKPSKQSSISNISIADKLQFKPGTGIDEKNYSASAEFWNKASWGIAGSIEINDLKIINAPKNSSTRNLDVNKKLFSSEKQKSYLALGLGWKDVSYGDTIDAEGINLSLLGELSLTNNLLVYGKGSVFESINTDYTVSGYRIETGVTYKSDQQFSFSAGVRLDELDNQFGDSEAISSSFLLGTHLSF